jgi:hypothetical protein
MMADALPLLGMVGPFWVVQEQGAPAIIAVGVPLAQAVSYGDMLTVETWHYEHWTVLSRSSAAALKAARVPTAPLWSEYEEWPRGRVLYDCESSRFVVRADRQLHRPAFIRLIVDAFAIADAPLTVLADDHYRSVRRVAPPTL